MCSFQHLGLLSRDIGRYRRMSRKLFGQSIVFTLQMMELQLSIGCNFLIFFYKCQNTEKKKMTCDSDQLVILQYLHLGYYLFSLKYTFLSILFFLFMLLLQWWLIFGYIVCKRKLSLFCSLAGEAICLITLVQS